MRKPRYKISVDACQGGHMHVSAPTKAFCNFNNSGHILGQGSYREE